MGSNPFHFKGDNLPIEWVSRNEANEFCENLSVKTGRTYSLPTEAQWEYACRAGSQTIFCFGDSEKDMKHYAWYVENSDKKTHPVGQKRPNKWGLFDMHGNVWEWCSDWYREYEGEEVRNPTGPKKGRFMVLRGGSWCNHPNDCRSACRYYNFPHYRSISIGFRVVIFSRTPKK